MKKYILLCSASAVLGSAAALLLIREPLGSTLALAQERGPTPAPTRASPPSDELGDGLRLAQRPAAPPRPAAADRLGHLTPEERVNVSVYEKGSPSVVNINTRAVRGDGFFMAEGASEDAGSGCVLDRRGNILTNYHVIERADEVQVTLADGSTYDAKLVGTDPNNDIAVIKIDAPAALLSPVTYGDSSTLLVGQNVYAIGNPFGLERTFTTGVISYLNRALRSPNRRLIRSIIQLDAAINPGSSGGPLLDSQGKMIGMNTAIAGKTGQSSGVGFAIPVSTIARVVPQLIENGRVIRGDIGISQVRAQKGGVQIVSLISDGPAEKAGLKGYRIVLERRRQGAFVVEQRRVDPSQADVIVAIEGNPVQNEDELRAIVEGRKPGDTVRVTVVRDGRQEVVSVKLGEGE
jgi:S1-C subfamily serine protease